MRRSQNGTQLPYKRVRLFKRATYGAQAQGGVEHKRSGVVGVKLFFGADIQSTNNHRFAVHRLKHFLVSVHLFFFARRLLAFKIQKLGSVKTDAVGAACFKQTNIFGEFYIGEQFNVNFVF